MPGAIVIKVIKGLGADVEMLFSDSFIIRRSKSADYTVNEPKVSRQHARVELEGGGR